ncbi:unnamed protein product, partial [Rotaria socialis]
QESQALELKIIPQDLPQVWSIAHDFLGQDCQASWAARRADTKPTTIDEIHEQEQHHDQSLATIVDTVYSGGNQKQNNDGRGSRSSGINQESNRNDDDRAWSLALQRTRTKGSRIEKKPEEDRSFDGRTGKPPAGPIQQRQGKVGSSQGVSTYSMQRQLSPENGVAV